MYHNIAPEKDFNTVSLSDFEAQMKYISEHFNPVAADEYIAEIDGANKKRYITVTFDDAYVCLRELVLPIIKKYKVPLIIFVPTHHVGNYNTWDGGAHKTTIMTWEEIKELDQEPLITFGSHGYDHVSFGHITAAVKEKEFRQSKEDLEHQLGKKTEFFAYPFGQLEHREKRDVGYLKKNGYKAAFTTNWSRNNSSANIYALNRIDILPDTGVAGFIDILTRRFQPKFYKQIAKNIVHRLKLK
ncbi:hypothetical protein NIASO_01020 [Niabella soli DSM 19437]|uniref:NodB homology domain-containing protein n=2 Tax=Niabella TaxID=379899 RepID=W0F227_9BACT|nr:hypothetical protein NIASO_01020 [Niabella soli DSM 19437]